MGIEPPGQFLRDDRIKFRQGGPTQAGSTGIPAGSPVFLFRSICLFVGIPVISLEFPDRRNVLLATPVYPVLFGLKLNKNCTTAFSETVSETVRRRTRLACYWGVRNEEQPQG
jgi:hypothetical protein